MTENSANDGILNTAGLLSVALNGPVAFNIVDVNENNGAWLVAGAASRWHGLCLDMEKRSMSSQGVRIVSFCNLQPPRNLALAVP